jgi:hypothetical protein
LPLDGLQIDHRNNEQLDNRLANLRVATHADNQRNRPAQRNNVSGIEGSISTGMLAAGANPPRWEADSSWIFRFARRCRKSVQRRSNQAARRVCLLEPGRGSTAVNELLAEIPESRTACDAGQREPSRLSSR